MTLVYLPMLYASNSQMRPIHILPVIFYMAALWMPFKDTRQIMLLKTLECLFVLLKWVQNSHPGFQIHMTWPPLHCQLWLLSHTHTDLHQPHRPPWSYRDSELLPEHSAMLFPPCLYNFSHFPQVSTQPPLSDGPSMTSLSSNSTPLLPPLPIALPVYFIAPEMAFLISVLPTLLTSIFSLSVNDV